MKYLLFIFLLLYAKITCSQCNVMSSFGQYNLGSCGDVTIQSFLGTSVSLYGNCGSVQITPPFGDGGLISGTSDSNLDDLFISPNPSTGISDIKSFEAVKCIEVYTTLGQIVLRSEDYFHERQFDFTQFRDGLYLVKIQFVNSQVRFITKSIIISR